MNAWSVDTGCMIDTENINFVEKFIHSIFVYSIRSRNCNNSHSVPQNENTCELNYNQTVPLYILDLKLE